jgi:hypothetical protein
MSTEDRLARLERLAGVAEQKPVVVIENMEGLLVQAKDLPPEVKVEMIKAMGFGAQGDDHQPDCPAQYTRGIRCNCVPPATVWTGPRDVAVFLKETWDERRALAEKWTREQSHGRRD